MVIEPFSKIGTYSWYLKDVFYSNEEITWKREKNELEDGDSRRRAAKGGLMQDDNRSLGAEGSQSSLGHRRASKEPRALCTVPASMPTFNE